MAEVVRVNFKLYKAIALINVRYDGQSYQEGEELSIRETDIEELADERHYVEMKERPDEQNNKDQEDNIPPKQEQQEEHQEEKVEEGKDQEEGE